MPPCQAANGLRSTLGIVKPPTFVATRGLNCTLQSSRNAFAELRIAAAFRVGAQACNKMQKCLAAFLDELGSFQNFEMEGF